MEIYEKNGDDWLSVFDRKIWSLCYSCLMNYSCPVIFKIQRPDCSRKINKHIMFFIPKDHPNNFLVKEYLKNELASEELESSEKHGYFEYGVKVSLHEFSGIDYYLEKFDMNIIVENTMEKFKDLLDNKEEDNA